eukprot:gene19747-25679_t
MDSCKSYDEWKALAEELDSLQGWNIWRKEEFCPFYDYKVVSKRIRDTKDMIKKGDVFHLMFRLRGGLARDQFGIQHEGLFAKALGGTKHLVEQYHDTMSTALKFIAETPESEDDIPSDAKLAFFNETRHAFGRTALLLSGGAALGYYHMGLVKSLWQQQLLPRVISGASAGSLFAAAVGTRTDEEFLSLLDSDSNLLQFRYQFFKYSTEVKSPTGKWILYYTPKIFKPLFQPILSLIFDKKIINLDTEHFKKVVINLAGHYTFQEAFDRTGRIINITVAPLNNYDPPRLLNYLTAPHVCVWSAAAASCALPGIFDSFTLVVKEPNGNFSAENIWTRKGHIDYDPLNTQSYSDGSVENDLPMKQLSELFNVSHFIVSQVNPHSALLSSLTLQTSVWSPPIYGAVVSYIRFLRAQCRDWLKNVSTLLISRALAPVWSNKRGITMFLTQDYEGRAEDITIFPWKGHISVFKSFLLPLTNFSEKEFIDIFHEAEKASWPYISRIRANCMVELTLDRCVQSLRRKISLENDKATIVNKSIDRTPSFYTSRSIVNLSGLSVADPLPKTYRPLDISYPSKIIEVDEDKEMDTLNLTVVANDIPLADTSNKKFTSNSNFIPIISPVNRTKRQRSKSLSSNEKDIVTQVTHMPLSMSSNSNSNVGMFLDDDLSQSNDSDILNKIKKTTSMAKFYYRETRSDDALNAYFN